MEIVTLNNHEIIFVFIKLVDIISLIRPPVTSDTGIVQQQLKIARNQQINLKKK